ncbi:MAG: alpha/beta hydrolase, partial [Sphingobacteriales bacterium]
KKIGLIGHSEGGLIAPMVAARNKDVAFIVLMAGPGVNGKEVLRIQIDLLNRAAGMSEVESQKQVAFTTGIMDIIQMGGDSTVKSAALRAYLYKGYEALPDDVKKQMTEQQFSLEYSSFNTPWFSYFMQYEPALALEKIKIPVLVLNGTKDLQVWAPQNLPAIEKALKKGGNKKYVIKELPNLNHLFQEAKTGGSSEYSEIEQTLSPLLLEEITRFLKQKTNLP